MSSIEMNGKPPFHGDSVNVAIPSASVFSEGLQVGKPVLLSPRDPGVHPRIVVEFSLLGVS